MARCARRRRWPARACPIAWGRRSIRAAPCRSRSRSTHRRSASSSDSWAKRAIWRKRAPSSSGIVSRERRRRPSQQARTFWNRLTNAVQVKTPDAAMDVMLNRLAALPDAVVPDLGALRLLSVERRLRFPRSAAGCPRLALRIARYGASPSPARGVAPVHRRRRAALVARAGRPGRAHPVLRRSALARIRDVASTSRPPATIRCSTSRCRSSRDDRSTPTSTRPTNGRRVRARVRPSTSTASGRSRSVCQTGAHGLPLMGTGDWNDGMNLVGAGGRGESVWLGWFLVSLLRPFADIAEARGERDRASAYRRHATSRCRGARTAAWDGQLVSPRLFRRRNAAGIGGQRGVPDRLRSRSRGRSSPAGPIADRARARRWNPPMRTWFGGTTALILLLTPPFDKTTPSPGYIQGYVPGVRENGGQYTHGALWTVLAFARLGDGDRRRSSSRCSTRSITDGRRTRCSAIAPSPTWSRPTSTRNRRTPGGAAGPGTPGRPAGCIASAWKRSSACRSNVAPCASTPAFRARGHDTS